MVHVNETVDDFKRFVASIEDRADYRRPRAFAIGLATLDSEGRPIDTYFPHVNHRENYGSAAVFASLAGHMAGTSSYTLPLERWVDVHDLFKPFIKERKKHSNVDCALRVFEVKRRHTNENDTSVAVVVSFIDEEPHDTGPQTVSDTYLRLHLLSHRKVLPNTIPLNGLFGILPNNAWTSEGPIALDDVQTRIISARYARKHIRIFGVDKIPHMLDYVVPSGVRVADGARVRLGAYLGVGTTVMQEGFVNFNAGTLGASMVEGRISQGVVVGDQSDIGGGASIMGTLSGGGKEKITVGRGVLLGANSGTGISLGDLCVVEAGLYITAGTPVLYKGETVKARALSGKGGLTFLRNATTGAVEALDKPNAITLNKILHTHA